MVSRHTANVLSADARLGSIPRLSATFLYQRSWVSGGYWLAAPACKAECSLGSVPVRIRGHPPSKAP